MEKITVNLGPAIFNPLTALEATADFKSESAVQNSIAGICPKCKSPMGTAQIANGDTVHWCAACFVASPMLNTQ